MLFKRIINKTAATAAQLPYVKFNVYALDGRTTAHYVDFMRVINLRKDFFLDRAGVPDGIIVHASMPESGGIGLMNNPTVLTYRVRSFCNKHIDAQLPRCTLIWSPTHTTPLLAGKDTSTGMVFLYSNPNTLTKPLDLIYERFNDVREQRLSNERNDGGYQYR